MVEIKKKPTSLTKLCSYFVTLFVITFLATYFITGALLPKNVFAFSGNVDIELDGVVTGMVPYNDCQSTFSTKTESDDFNCDWDIGVLEFINANTPIVISITANNVADTDVNIKLSQPKGIENLAIKYMLNGESFVDITQSQLVRVNESYNLELIFSVINSSVNIDNAVINFALYFEAV